MLPRGGYDAREANVVFTISTTEGSWWGGGFFLHLSCPCPVPCPKALRSDAGMPAAFLWLTTRYVPHPVLLMVQRDQNFSFWADFFLPGLHPSASGAKRCTWVCVPSPRRVPSPPTGGVTQTCSEPLLLSCSHTPPLPPPPREANAAYTP